MTARMYAVATSAGAASAPADPARAAAVDRGADVVPTEPPVSVEQAAIHARNSSATTEATARATTCRRLGEGSAGSASPGSGPFPSPEIGPEGKVRRVRSRLSL